MDEWIKLRRELNKHHLSPLGEKLLPEVILKLSTKGRKLNAETVAAEVEAAVIRHRAKSASVAKDKLKERARNKAKEKRRKAK